MSLSVFGVLFKYDVNMLCVNLGVFVDGVILLLGNDGLYEYYNDHKGRRVEKVTNDDGSFDGEERKVNELLTARDCWWEVLVSCVYVFHMYHRQALRLNAVSNCHK